MFFDHRFEVKRPICVIMQLYARMDGGIAGSENESTINNSHALLISHSSKADLCYRQCCNAGKNVELWISKDSETYRTVVLAKRISKKRRLHLMFPPLF